MKALCKELNQARNLVDAWNVLGRIACVVERLSALCAFPVDPNQVESKRESKKRLAKWEESEVLRERFDLRAEYGEIKNWILNYAKDGSRFTVDDVISAHKLNQVIPRRVWSANLYSLATKGKKPLKRVKQGTRGRGSESPAIYTLRR